MEEAGLGRLRGPGWGQSDEGSSRRLRHSPGKERPRTGSQAAGWGRGAGEPGKPRGPLTSRRKGREWPARCNSRSGRSRKESRPTGAPRSNPDGPQKTKAQSAARRRGKPPHHSLLAALQPRARARALGPARTRSAARRSSAAPPPWGRWAVWGGPVGAGPGCFKKHAPCVSESVRWAVTRRVCVCVRDCFSCCRKLGKGSESSFPPTPYLSGGRHT